MFCRLSFCPCFVKMAIPNWLCSHQSSQLIYIWDYWRDTAFCSSGRWWSVLVLYTSSEQRRDSSCEPSNWKNKHFQIERINYVSHRCLTSPKILISPDRGRALILKKVDTHISVDSSCVKENVTVEKKLLDDYRVSNCTRHSFIDILFVE